MMTWTFKRHAISSVVISLTLLFGAVFNVSANEATSDTAVLYYHHDYRGDPVVVTREDGRIQWIESYRAYGEAEPRVSSAGIGFGDNVDENSMTRQGYTGHEKDAASNLTYMKARHFDNLTGRFLSNDPVGYTPENPVQSFNRYMYTNSNPYTYTDPDGKQLEFIGNRELVLQTISDLTEIAKLDPSAAAAIIQLHESKNVHTFDVGTDLSEGNQVVPKFGGRAYLLTDGSENDGTSTTIYYDPTNGTFGGIDDSGSNKRPPMVGLAHELGHAAQFDDGTHPRRLDSDKFRNKPYTPNHESGLSMQFDRALRGILENVNQRTHYEQE